MSISTVETERAWLAGVRTLVEGRLATFFAEGRARSDALAPEASELIDAIEALTMRGGKRVRPALLVSAFHAVAPDRDVREVLDACAALELLQSYLLIHDDWMDDDVERRGGPAVHVALAGRHGGDAALGARLAILAGNLASAQAWELLTASAPDDAGAHAAAIEIFHHIHREVVVGQALDLVGSADVSRMHQLKTGSYTVRGPVAIGAVLANASDAQLAALHAYGAPLGEAFQLRDDLLGTFGDRDATGKPTDRDLRSGKRTALIAEAEARASAAELASIRAASAPEASEREIDDAREALDRCGARAAVEARLSGLLTEAVAALDGAPLHAPGTTRLRALAAMLTERNT